MAGMVRPTIKRQADHNQKFGAHAVSSPPSNSIPKQRKKEIFLPTLYVY